MMKMRTLGGRVSRPVLEVGPGTQSQGREEGGSGQVLREEEAEEVD